MNEFKLPTGRLVNKGAEFCVGVKIYGRWSFKYFKTKRGALNEEFRWTYAKKRDPHEGIDDVCLLTPN